MKIMYLNIYFGCKDRFQQLVDFIKKESPDVLGMSELNGWEQNDFKTAKEFQKVTGLPHMAFCHSKSDFSLALFSKQKIVSQECIQEGFKTGLVKVKIQYKGKTLTFFLTHLHHIDEDTRLEEVDILQKHFPKQEPFVLMGDLNSLSPQDPYNDASLLAELKKLKLTKFGTDKLRKDVISRLIDIGIVDVIREKLNSFEYTVPTKYNKDEAHFSKLRIDYMFTTKNILVRRAEIVRSKETNQISDHFPVVIEID